MKKARLLFLLALLMTAATGAWAQTSDKETPLTLQATANGMIYIFYPKVGMKYKVGDGEKQTVQGTDNVAINVTAGQTVQFFGDGTSITAYGVEQGSNSTYFNSNVKCYIYGNIMSLVDETDFATATVLTADYAFKLLFSGFRNLSNHASRKLVLPAMTLTKECYYCMFELCTSLTTAPLLPAPTLAQQCYNFMFSGCTNLNAVTCLATNISAQGATKNWLKDVAATGTLTIAKGMEDKWTANSASGIPSGWSTDVYGFKVKLADGTADAGNWTATVGTSTTAKPLPVGGLSNGDAVTLTYNGRLKVKAVTATHDGWNGDLGNIPASALEADGQTFIVPDGTTLKGTLDVSTITYKVVIPDRATVTLDDVTIEGTHVADYAYRHAGITCLGDATIILKDNTTNTVKGFNEEYPGIHVPTGKTLIIKGGSEGNGKLTASSNGWAAGIGGGYNLSCGNITISGGTVEANGGQTGAGIGGGYNAPCGNISITGGTVTATGNFNAAGIGSSTYSTCGNITISGGTVEANGGQNGAGIGSGLNGTSGNITITEGVTLVTATKGEGAPYSIGKGTTNQNGTSSCGTITIGCTLDTNGNPVGGTVYSDGVIDSPFNYPPSN